jgi:uncharacterized repeat protein (TIGR03803 family)
MEGGVYGFGVVYKLTASGKYKVLHSFTGVDGQSPYSGVIRDPQHNLYGTTEVGGAYGHGTVFKLDVYGTETVLYSFTGGADGGAPAGELIRDSAGNLYGTTVEGGGCALDPTNGCGTVFKLDPFGNLIVLHTFTGLADGAGPFYGPLVRAAGGSLYGTTAWGGAYGFGTLFKLDYYGNFTVLHTFTGAADGGGPYAGVIRTAAGSFFGTTTYGGQNHGGVFKVDASGKLSVVHNFTDSDMESAGTLVRDDQNNLYGVTYGGSNGSGKIFKLTPP